MSFDGNLLVIMFNGVWMKEGIVLLGLTGTFALAIKGQSVGELGFSEQTPPPLVVKS